MTDHDSLLRAITDNPAEDTPRLMYADALDERGWKGDRERGEFIRVQVGLARMVPPSDCDGTFCDGSLVVCQNCKEWKSLYRREKELAEMMVPRDPRGSGATSRQTQGRYYFAECGCPLAGFSLRRGFLEQITVTTEDFLAHAAEIFTRHPVERVTLAGKNPQPQHTGRFGWCSFEECFNDPVWFSGSNPATPSEYQLPDSIFGEMKLDTETLEHSNRTWVMYRTDPLARQAASDACVDFGRQAAAKARLGAAVAI